MGKKYKGKFFSPMKDFVSTRIDHQSMYLCQPDSLKTILMDSVFHNFNLLTFVIQIIIYINIVLCHEIHYMWWVN